MRRAHTTNWITLGLLVLQLVPAPTAGADPAATAPYAGWAVEAYPDQSASQMRAMVKRIAGAGANVVWIGHNNPGEVAADKVEPGLSYAVFEAYLDETSPYHDDAVEIVRAQHRILAACRAAGIPAVLPVGYQIQMGRAWNAIHPDALRRSATGEMLDIYGGGVSASFHAPSYRQAIETFYRWVETEFVVPYSDTLLMLNLADEPIGGDYSAHAEAEFRRRTGFGFADVGDSLERQQLLGAFQSNYVVEYAAFSASLWQEIHPGLTVTMSFDGGQARRALALPDAEALFRDTPSNFAVTFDAYPHDGLPTEPASNEDITGLFLLARSLGAYSARYGKPVWLWAAANSWGLSQPSPDPGTISDALANGISLAMLVRQAGGDLRGIVYWNYNVKQQGLYNNTGPTVYGAGEMFSQVSEALPTLRRLMQSQPGRPNVVLLAPDDLAHQQIGVLREAVRAEAYPLGQLTLLAQSGANVVVVGDLDGWLENATTVLVLSASADALPRDDRLALAEFLDQGGSAVISAGVATHFQPAAGETASSGTPGRLAGLDWAALHGLVEGRGNLLVAHPDVGALLREEWRALLAPFWSAVFGVAPLEPAYRIVTDELAFYYHLGPEPVTWQLRFPFEGSGSRYNGMGEPVERVHGPYTILTLERREYALIWRMRLVHWARV